MALAPVIIIGSSGHAKVVIDIVQQEGRHRIVGLLDRYRTPGEQTLGYPILGMEEDLPELVKVHGLRGILIAIGDNQVRADVAARVRELCPALPFVGAVHPSATVGLGVALGAGTVVMAGAVINACAAVGQLCIINTHASLDHDSTMGDFASLAPGVVTGGNCHIGHHAAIGIGAVLLHRMTVGEHSVVGAGALVTRPVPPLVVAYGSPAKVVSSRAAGDRYL